MESLAIRFTPSERNILALLVQGKGPTAIAENLGKQAATIKNQIYMMCQRSGQDHSLGLMLWWIQYADIQIVCPCKECKSLREVHVG